MAPNIPAEDLHRMEQAMQHLSMMKSGISEQNPDQLASGYESGDNEDSDYLQDDLADVKTRTKEDEVELDRRLMAQKKIDDARIGIVYEALSKGVELKENKLYQDMLEKYPYFQKIRSERKAAMTKLARLAKITGGNSFAEEASEEGRKNKFTPKYKFEQRFVKKFE